MRLLSRGVSLIAVVLVLASVPAFAADWRPLGERQVDYRTNPVRIDATAGAGAVSKIKIEVKQNNLEVGNVKVTFADGQTFQLDLNKYIGAGGSRTFDLPGAKEIQNVEVSYRKASSEDRLALVRILGSV